MNPVVEGIVRPKQDRLQDAARARVIPVLIHGDAAMSGQGIVAETLNLSQVDGYNTGGSMHLVINNQIGFTTDPRESRSTNYCSDVALMVKAPVFHVNGDDPEACIRAAQMAYDFRQLFHRDVVIDMLCWRKHGHNEGDDASYTQPVLYRQLKEHKVGGGAIRRAAAKEGRCSPAEEIAAGQEAQREITSTIFTIRRRRAKKSGSCWSWNPIAQGSACRRIYRPRALTYWRWSR